MNRFRSRKYKELQLLIKGPGEMFGYEEILEKLTERRSSCVCISPTAELYVISEKDFQKRIPNPETWKYLNDTHNLKTDWEKNRMNKLLKVEEYKNKMAFTPSKTMKPKPTSSISPKNRDTKTPRDISASRSALSSRESRQISFYNEVVRIRRNTQTKNLDILSETQGSSRLFKHSKSIFSNTGLMRSLTPGTDPKILESKIPPLDNHLNLFRTEISTEEPIHLSKIKKQRRYLPSYIPKFKDGEMLQIRSASRDSPIFMPLSSYTPTKLKPSRNLKRKLV